MLRRLTFLAVLLLTIGTLPVLALDDPAARTDRAPRTVIVVDEVIRMAQAGVSDDAIISYVRNSREPFDVSSDDLIAMTNARVSERVIKAVEEEAGRRDSRDSYDRRDTRDTRESRSTVFVSGYPYYYDPFYYPYYYDPFFYGPRFSLGVGFGFGGHRFIGGGRGFHHRR